MMYYLASAILWAAVSLLCLLIMLFTRYRSDRGLVAVIFSSLDAVSALALAPERYWWLTPLYLLCFFIAIGAKLGMLLGKSKRR